mmetsp:Transcript_3433/g.10104  ORF Transcript_3433/g.10104 Transcript_3433/m.10104 type:complete len:242 (+) Transcript_3433:1283-2008(+)
MPHELRLLRLVVRGLGDVVQAGRPVQDVRLGRAVPQPLRGARRQRAVRGRGVPLLLRHLRPPGRGGLHRGQLRDRHHGVVRRLGRLAQEERRKQGLRVGRGQRGPLHGQGRRGRVPRRVDASSRHSFDEASATRVGEAERARPIGHGTAQVRLRGVQGHVWHVRQALRRRPDLVSCGAGTSAHLRSLPGLRASRRPSSRRRLVDETRRISSEVPTRVEAAPREGPRSSGTRSSAGTRPESP